MDLARVVGTVVCSVKDPRLRGVTLLLVQPLDGSGKPLGAAQVALDAVGAGPGEIVVLASGREASHAFLPALVPADVAAVGIVDPQTRSASEPPPRARGRRR